MASFPKTAAGIQHVQINFDRGRELKLHSFVSEFMEEYDASGLTPSVISKIGFGNLGRFLHNVSFLAWSHSVCGHKKPPIEFLDDCLVGKHARPVIYYIAGWMLHSASKALTIARDKRLFFLEFPKAHSIDEDITCSKFRASCFSRGKEEV